MDINQIIFKIVYDPVKDGSLSDFREKKYRPFQEHILRLQANGILPRAAVKLAIEKKHVTPPMPDGPAMVAAFVRKVPLLLHSANTPLELAG